MKNGLVKLIKRVKEYVRCIVLRKFVLWEKFIKLIFNGSHLNLTLTQRKRHGLKLIEIINALLESFDVDDFKKSSNYNRKHLT